MSWSDIHLFESSPIPLFFRLKCTFTRIHDFRRLGEEASAASSCTSHDAKIRQKVSFEAWDPPRSTERDFAILVMMKYFEKFPSCRSIFPRIFVQHASFQVRSGIIYAISEELLCWRFAFVMFSIVRVDTVLHNHFLDAVCVVWDLFHLQNTNCEHCVWH